MDIGIIRRTVDAILYPLRMLSRLPSQLISSPRRMMGLSLPARAALLLLLGLLVVIIAFCLVVYFDPDRQDFSGWFWQRFWYMLALVIAIPLVSWYALKLWLEGEKSPYPDIDAAWSGALEKLQQQAIDATETPLFLVLGPGTPEGVASLFEASNLAFAVRTPVGPSPLHVYANREAIYVVCTESSQVGRLTGGRLQGGPMAAEAPVQPTGGFDPSRTMQVGFEGGGGPAAPAERRRDLPADLPTMPVPGAGPAAAAPGGGDAIRGTMFVGGQTMLVSGAPQAMQPQPSAQLAPAESLDATARLRHVCRLLRKLRDPLCPVNGLLVTTPFTLIADGSEQSVNQLLRCLKSDLTTVRSALRVRCSVTHVITGMEAETGFRELVRRVGAERAGTQRFGKGFGLWNPPTADQLDALVRHACGAFEDWSYLLFREGEGLSRPGNRHLYALLCRVRSTFRKRLGNLVTALYAVQPDANELELREPLLFSGCYFAATGATPDRQAFLRSVFHKMRAEEEELDWGSEAWGEERRMQTGTQLLLAIDGVLLAALLVMLLYQFVFRDS